MPRRRSPAAVVAALALLVGCGGAGHRNPGAGNTTSTSSASAPTAAPGYGAGSRYMPIISGAIWDYVDVGASGGPQHLNYQVTSVAFSTNGTTANLTVTTGTGKVDIAYVVDSRGNVQVQLAAGQGNLIIPASPLSCSPCRYTASFTGSVAGFPPFTEHLTETVTSAGTVGLADPENHQVYPGVVRLHTTIDILPGAGGPPVAVSTTEEVDLASGIGIVEEGNGSATVTVAGNTHTAPTGTLWLTSYIP